MLESGVGRADNIAMSTLPGFTLPGDVSASRRYWHEDIIDPEVTVSAAGDNSRALHARTRIRAESWIESRRPPSGKNPSIDFIHSPSYRTERRDSIRATSSVTSIPDISRKAEISGSKKFLVLGG